MIFSHVLYQLSYLALADRMNKQCGSQTPSGAVAPLARRTSHLVVQFSEYNAVSGPSGAVEVLEGAFAFTVTSSPVPCTL